MRFVLLIDDVEGDEFGADEFNRAHAAATDAKADNPNAAVVLLDRSTQTRFAIDSPEGAAEPEPEPEHDQGGDAPVPKPRRRR